MIRLSILSLFFLLSIQLIGQTEDSTSINVDSVAIERDSIKIDGVDEMVDELIEADSMKLKKVNIEFIKKKVEQSSDSGYFNLCKITNTTSNTIQGNFRLSVPTGWNLIADPSSGIEIGPGETKVFAIRLTIPANAVGGVAYVIDATVDTREGNYSGVTYIKIPLKSKWDMSVNQHTIYFNEYFDEMDFKVRLENKGNASELIKLKFNIGKLLHIVDMPDKEFYVEVPPYTDTSLIYSVKRGDLNEDEKIVLKQIWKESVIGVKASSGQAKAINESIWFKDLENVYVNIRNEKSSPLNIDASVFNLLSSNQPKLNAMLFGELQFKGDHDLNYVFQARNIFYKTNSGVQYFDNPYNTTFRIKYEWKEKFKAEVGELYNFSLHSLRGWGARAKYNFNDKDKVSVSYVTGKYFPGWGVTGLYETKFKNVGFRIGETYEQNDYLHYNAASTELGVNFSPVKNHLIGIGLLGTRANFDMNQGVGTPSDSTMLGMTYTFNYNGRFNKFRVGVSSRNDQFNVIRVRPINLIQANARYLINTQSRINATLTYNSSKTSNFVNNPYYNGIYSNQAIYKLTYSRVLSSKLVLETGPMIRAVNRFVIDTSDVLVSDFNNIFYGIFSQVRIKFDEVRVLTPRISIGATGFKNKLSPSVQISEMLSVNVGFSYLDKGWGLNVNYLQGPNFFLTEDFFLLGGNSIETIHLRTHFDKLLFNRKVKFTGFANYYLRLPSNRQNFVVSSRFTFDLGRRWSAYIVGNLFTTSLDEEEAGIVTHRNFSLNAGLKKSFDIAQPRIKYYDLTVVCFNDFNGNGEREENEPLLSNIKITTSKNANYPSAVPIRFAEQELVTNTEGTLKIIDLPEGGYVLDFEPMANLGNLYNPKGDVQEILMSEDMTLYIPYVESYKVKGRVVLIRDEFSNKGLINVGGIRVSATTLEGDVYSALTDNDGNYLINVPQAGYYTVKVNNIFGSEFELDKEQFLVQFNGFKSFNVDFTFFEGKRKVNMSGGNFFNFGSLNSSGDGSTDDGSSSTGDSGDGTTGANNRVNVGDDVMEKAEIMKSNIDAISLENEKSITSPIDPDKVKFMVEVGVFTEDVPIDVANKMMEMGIVPTPIKIEGMTIYATQIVDSNTEVKTILEQIKSTGFTEAIVVGSYDGKIISEEKAIEFKNQ